MTLFTIVGLITFYVFLEPNQTPANATAMTASMKISIDDIYDQYEDEDALDEAIEDAIVNKTDREHLKPLLNYYTAQFEGFTKPKNLTENADYLFDYFEKYATNMTKVFDVFLAAMKKQKSLDKKTAQIIRGKIARCKILINRFFVESVPNGGEMYQTATRFWAKIQDLFMAVNESNIFKKRI